MPLSLRAARRASVVLALSCTTVLSGTAASAAAGHAGHTGRPGATPRCSLSRLLAWIGLPGSGAAGSTAYPLEFSNVSGRACHLSGYPGVSAIGRDGRQLGSPAHRDTTFRPRLVLLRRGWTAHAVLTITDAGNFPARACRVRTADALRITPPGAHRSAFVPLSFPACSRRGPVYLHVRVVRAGVGIPGASQ
ncbi:MAG TPA: DUF4232 domain-containing protein [Streptosporangiaceae bacterium]|nr:DUF4232 domain-containing protein [Streptosporangiaceae bacterium]